MFPYIKPAKWEESAKCMHKVYMILMPISSKRNIVGLKLFNWQIHDSCKIKDAL